MLVVLWQRSEARLEGWRLRLFWGAHMLGPGHGLLYRARPACKYNKWASEAGCRWQSSPAIGEGNTWLWGIGILHGGLGLTVDLLRV